MTGCRGSGHLFVPTMSHACSIPGAFHDGQNGVTSVHGSFAEAEKSKGSGVWSPQEASRLWSRAPSSLHEGQGILRLVNAAH